MSYPDFHALPVAPAALPIEGEIWKVGPATRAGAVVDCCSPRALTLEKITIVHDFLGVARNAIAAGFDRVEIHGANVYRRHAGTAKAPATIAPSR